MINGCVHALGSKTNWNSELKRFSSGFEQVTEA